MFQYNTPQRIGKFKGHVLAHATPMEVLGRLGHQVRRMPQNNSEVYVGRRWMPYGATTTNANTQNRFFADANGDRALAVVAAHQTAEGITITPDTMVPVDASVVIRQYSCLYAFTDKVQRLYEDDVPAEAKKQTGERMALVNELIAYGALRACTNVYYGGAGTSIATVDGKVTINRLHIIMANLQANHAKQVTSMLAASTKFATEPVSPGFVVVCHTDLESDIRKIPDFTPVEKYASGKPLMDAEVGKVERFRFLTSPDLPSLQNAGAAVGATGLYSTSGSNLDVYPILIFGEDAWSQIAVRGMDSMKMAYIPTGQSSPTDPFGQRGYAGAMWWKAVFLENHGWMALLYVGRTALGA